MSVKVDNRRVTARVSAGDGRRPGDHVQGRGSLECYHREACSTASGEGAPQVLNTPPSALIKKRRYKVGMCAFACGVYCILYVL